MASKAIRPKRDEGPLASGWQSIRESAPSALRVDQPAAPRWVALIGLMALALGGAAVVFASMTPPRPYLIGYGWGILFLGLGFGGLLYHAANEQEQQYRRLYAMLGVLFWVIGVGLRLLPYQREMGGLWLPYGSPALLVSLAFLGAYARNESDQAVRLLTTNLLGLTGLVLTLIGGGIGFFNENFLVTQGLMSLILGLLYLGVFVSLQDANSLRAYYGGLLIGILGGVMFAAAFLRCVGPWVLYWVHLRSSAPTEDWVVPSGLVLMYAGLEFLALGIGMTSDRPLAVLTRRELAAFFYSPIAYVIIVGMSIVGWFMYAQFVNNIFEASEEVGMGGVSQILIEPIVVYYIIGIFPIFCVIFVVPILTMRLLSEERRSGTLEVLLTAPVKETPVVLSKFLAAFRMYLLAWLPWALFLVAFRVEGGKEFDYRPLLGFFIVLAASGAGFLAMGVFFSALTRNQIAAAILTFVGMIFLTLLFFLQRQLPADSTLRAVMKYSSYVDLWIETLQGTFAPKYLVIHLSAAIFWLFLTVKVLEARKWS